MKKKLLLAAPPYDHSPGPFSRLARFAEPPLGLAYIAASVLEKCPGGTAEIIDGHAVGHSVDSLAESVTAAKPDAVGFTAATLTAPTVRRLCFSVRKKLPGCLILVGGSHPSALPGDLADVTDYVVIGEGENTVVELLTNGGGEDIPGTAFRDGNRLKKNPARRYEAELDDLPPPAYQLLPVGKYRYPYPVGRGLKGNFATMVTSRGCPGKCSFCAKGATWGDMVRYHSVDRVMDDLEYLVDKHSVSLVYFYDDTFLSDPDRLIEIAGRIRSMRRKLEWICQARADEVNGSLCRVMADSGCVKMEIGIESGYPEIRASVNKPISNAGILDAFRIAEQSGIRTKANVIFGFPEETGNTIDGTIDFTAGTQATYANFFHLVPFPGSELYNLYRSKGWLTTTDWSRFSYHGGSVVSVPGADAKILDRAVRRALRRFYIRPFRVKRIIFAGVRSGAWLTFWKGILSLLNGLFRREVHQKTQAGI